MEKDKRTAEKVDIAKLSNVEKKKMLQDVFVYSPRIKEILEAIEFCHKQSAYFPNPQCLCIVGKSGVGKSRLCSIYSQRYPEYELKTQNQVRKCKPILYSLVDSPTERALATTLLKALGDPFYLRGKNATEKTHRLVNLIKDCKVELIILDEVQHIYDRDSQKIIQSASNWIKNLITYTKVPVVLVGLTDTLSIIEDNEQLKSRFMYRFEITNFSLGSQKEENEFRTFLHFVDKKLPFKDNTNLADLEKAGKLYEASEGNTRVLMEQIIITAAIKAIHKGATKLEFVFIEEEMNKLAKSKICNKVVNANRKKESKNKKTRKRKNEVFYKESII